MPGLRLRLLQLYLLHVPAVMLQNEVVDASHVQLLLMCQAALKSHAVLHSIPPFSCPSHKHACHGPRALTFAVGIPDHLSLIRFSVKKRTKHKWLQGSAVPCLTMALLLAKAFLVI